MVSGLAGIGIQYIGQYGMIRKILAEGKENTVDQIVSKGLQRLLRKHGRIRSVFVIIARFGYILYILYGLMEWLRPGTVRERVYRRHTLLYCLCSVAAGSVVSFGIGRVWHRKRPFVQNKHIQDIIPHEANASFPSNHSMNAMAVSLILLSRHNLLGLPFLIWSGILGLARIGCGIHYLTDVLGGFAIGAGSTAFVRRSRTGGAAVSRLLWYYHIATTAVSVWWKKCH